MSKAISLGIINLDTINDMIENGEISDLPMLDEHVSQIFQHI